MPGVPDGDDFTRSADDDGERLNQRLFCFEGVFISGWLEARSDEACGRGVDEDRGR